MSRVVDAHTHVWGPDTDELPWRSAVLPPGWDGAYTARDLIADMDAAGVDEAVIVTTPLYGRGPRANEYTMRAIETFPDRLYGVSLLDLFGDEERVRADVRRVVGHERTLGIRMHACLRYEECPTELDPDADWIEDDALAPVWDEVARQDAAVFVFPKARQLPAVERLADDHPGVTVVVDHMAFPDESTAPDEAPWTAFEDLAAHDNVAVKLSSLPRSSEEPFPYEDMWGYVRRLVEWFGPERLMLGSDYPWMDDWADYADCLDWIESVPFLSARDAAYLAGRSFRAVHDR